MQLHDRKPTSLKRRHYRLKFAKLMLGKGNVTGWCRGMDNSNEVATGELTDGSNFNIIT